MANNQSVGSFMIQIWKQNYMFFLLSHVSMWWTLNWDPPLNVWEQHSRHKSIAKFAADDSNYPTNYAEGSYEARWVHGAAWSKLVAAGVTPWCPKPSNPWDHFSGNKKDSVEMLQGRNCSTRHDASSSERRHPQRNSQQFPETLWNIVLVVTAVCLFKSVACSSHFGPE